MSRIKEAFNTKKAFIGFLTAGDPSLEKTEEFIVAMADAGASIIEIGIPFSDPIAEGKIVQEANVRALSVPGGCTTDMIFEMVERVSKKVSVPLVFLTYLNPVFKYGYDRFCKRCKEVGIDGLIIPDMPYEEKNELKPFADENDLDIISFIAPSSIERIKMIAKDSSGYVYMVPSMDEEGEEASSNLDEIVKSVREVTDTPLVFGFKMNTVEQIAKKSAIVDGVIVDNSIVKLIEANGNDAGKYIHEYIKTVVERINRD